MVIKIASEDWEFDQMFSLNYQTFVDEIPQHQKNESRQLVDKFHGKNQYIIALQDKELIGMLSINEHRPFSLDQKLPNLNELLPTFSNGFEIRLLSVKNEHRGNIVFLKLFSKLSEIIEEKRYDIGLISGITTQQKLYKKIGFVPFGPLLGADGVQFQPMYITYDRYKNSINTLNLVSKF